MRAKAIGESACVSVHGGNRLGANSLLDTLVFGRRSGQHASEAVKSKSHKNITDESGEPDRRRIQGLLDNEKGEMFGKLRAEMGDTMNKNLAVYRDQQGMEQSLDTVRQLKERYRNVYVPDKGKTFNTNLIFTLEQGFMLDCAESVCLSALERKESRGAQFRTDYPSRDDENWLRHILMTKGEIGPEISYLPVTVTNWTLEERKY